MNKTRLKNIVSRFKTKNVLVVGDVILDHHIFGKVDRISPEAPVPIVWAREQKYLCGGAANAGLNIRSLGGQVSLCGAVGGDHLGRVLLNLIGKNNINTKLITKDKKRLTTLKTRITAQHQQIARVDWESIESLSLEKSRLIVNKIRKSIDNFDAVIIEDYGKGVVNPYLVGELVSLCKQKGKIISVDPKEEHFDYYKNVTALTPNLKEAQTAVNIKIKDKKQIRNLGKKVMEKLKPQVLLMTLGEEGMMLFFDKTCQHIPTAALEVFDVTGAGDTVISTFTLALSCGAKYEEAAIIANLAAGVVVGKLGAATVSKGELIRTINGKQF